MAFDATMAIGGDLLGGSVAAGAGVLDAGGAMDMGAGLGGDLGSFGGITPLDAGGFSLSPLTALIGANAISGLLGANAARTAGQLQANAANNATAAQLQMFNTLNAQGAPYRQAGTNALSRVASFAGIPGYETGASITPGAPQDNTFFGYGTKPFTASDLNANLAPNWQFALSQGQGAAANALNAVGGMGGNYGKGLVDYTLNKSGDQYQQAFQNYNTNQANIFNRLAAVAGLGQTANQQSVSAGTGLAPGIASTIVGSGAANAAGLVGSTNALSGGLQNAASWYALPSFLNMGGNNA